MKAVNLYNGGLGDKQVKTYSGGMKRRLSVAISLIGDPKVGLLGREGGTMRGLYRPRPPAAQQHIQQDLDGYTSPLSIQYLFPP